jgi:hypothetical protein
LLGQALLQAKQITPDQLAIALAEQARQPEPHQKPLGELLLSLGFVEEEGLWPVLASLQQLPYRPYQDWQGWVADQPFGRLVAERFLMISWQRMAKPTWPPPIPNRQWRCGRRFGTA